MAKISGHPFKEPDRFRLYIAGANFPVLNLFILSEKTNRLRVGW